MTSAQQKAVATVITILLVCASFQQTQAHVKVKKLIKAGLVLGALASRKLPRVLPLPIPIPVNLNKEQEFSGGHFGNEYYGTGYGYGPTGGFGQGVYGGGGYAAQYGHQWY